MKILCNDLIKDGVWILMMSGDALWQFLINTLILSLN